MEKYRNQSPWTFLVRHLDLIRLILEKEIPEGTDRDDMLQEICLEYLMRTRFVHRQEGMIKVEKGPLLTLIVYEQLKKYRQIISRKEQNDSWDYLCGRLIDREGQENPEEQVLRGLEIQEILNSLDSEDISLLIQKYILGLDYQTLARIWNRSSKALICHMYRIRRRLRENNQEIPSLW